MKLVKPTDLNRWSPLVIWLAAGMAVLGVLATLEAWKDIFYIACRDEEASHIFLVPIVVLWLVWVRRERLRKCAPRPWIIGPLIIIVGTLAYLTGYNQGIQWLWHGGALLVVVGALLSVVGPGPLREFMPAFAVLVFLLPVPGRVRQEIALPMGTATADLTANIFDLMGVMITRSGNALTINGTPVLIAEACNGLRMVFALALVSYVFAFGLPLRSYVRVLVLAASPISAIACNIVRLVPTVWLYGYHNGPIPGWVWAVLHPVYRLAAYLSGATHAPTSPTWAQLFHDWSGWVMLPIAFVMLLGIIRLLRWALVPVERYTLAYG